MSTNWCMSSTQEIPIESFTNRTHLHLNQFTKYMKDSAQLQIHLYRFINSLDNWTYFGIWMIPVYHEPKKSYALNVLGLKHTLPLKNDHVILVVGQTDDVKIFISRFIPNNERSIIKHPNWSFAIFAIIELDKLWHGAADIFVGARAWNKWSELMKSYNLRRV